MMREPVATTKMRRVRVMTNILTKDAFSTFVVCLCELSVAKNRGFAQSPLFNVESHDVVSGQ